MYSQQVFVGGRLALTTDVRKDLTVVNPQWTELFLSHNGKTRKFGISLCPFPLASVEDSSVCTLPFVVLSASFLCLCCVRKITYSKEQSLAETRCLKDDRCIAHC